jgi:xylan 1,4-beta-xylosidase
MEVDNHHHHRTILFLSTFIKIHSGTQRLTVSTAGKTTVDVIAVRAGASTLQLMLSNFDYYNVPLSQQNINLKVTAQRAPNNLASVVRVDETHANAFPVWTAAGSPTYPSRALLEQLQAASELAEESVPVKYVGNNTYSVVITLPPYGVALITVDL